MKILNLLLPLLLINAGCSTVRTTEPLPLPDQTSYQQPASPPATAPLASPVQQFTPASTTTALRTTPFSRDKRVVSGPGLDPAIHVTSVSSSRGSDGYLKIELDVQNDSPSPKKFGYLIEWFDKNGIGFPLAANPSLQWMLRGNETSPIVAIAPSPNARNFKVTFLGPDDGS